MRERECSGLTQRQRHSVHSIPIPKNVSLDQAVSVPLGLVTLATGVWNHHTYGKSVGFITPYEEGGDTKYAGKPAFILGGSSSVS